MERSWGVMIRSVNCHSEVPPNFPKLMRNRSENQLQLSITINSHRGKSEDHLYFTLLYFDMAMEGAQLSEDYICPSTIPS